ncbi:hypothetical protein [Cytobacillus gottheilii]|uniref:hypothetical protein n=1 Tax=Cytobacillus gottheilii TaxID=859144 RepID=UPI0009BC5A82|nr:hypothetical protein [Cytobacillus gottheilii]
MKKKWISILVAAMFFFATGAFYYGGKPDDASANEEQVKEEIKSEFQDDVTVAEDEETDSENEINSKAPSDAAEPVKEEVDQGSKTEPAQVGKQEEKTDIEDKKPETIVSEDGYTYHLIEDKTKYSNLVELIDLAASFNLSLYGIDGSDVFALIKDGKVIGGLSTGSLSIDPEYKSFAIQKHSFYKDKGLEENIDLAIRTGASITVNFEEYTGYHIQYKDGTIIINH